jgi:hypothetical protein
LQRMLTFSNEVHHLRHFGLGDFARINAAISAPVALSCRHSIKQNDLSESDSNDKIVFMFNNKRCFDDHR